MYCQTSISGKQKQNSMKLLVFFLKNHNFDWYASFIPEFGAPIIFIVMNTNEHISKRNTLWTDPLSLQI